MRTISICVLGLTAALAGCSHSKSTFNSAVDLNAAPALARVLVFARMKNTGFNEKVYQGFETGMRAGLADCGVDSETLHVNDMDLEPETRFRDARARFKPNAVLVVREAGGQVVVGRYGTNSDLILDLQLFDSKTDKSFWHARSELRLLTRNLYADDGASGERFARDTVERLRTDGLLKNCKPPAPTEAPASSGPQPEALPAAAPPSSGPTIRGGQWSPTEAGPYRPPGT